MRRPTLTRRALFLALLPVGLLVCQPADVPRPADAAPAPPPPYGTVTGRVVLDGAAPARKVIHRKGAAVRDAACCAKEDLLAEDLVVDPKTNGIAHVFVFLPAAKKVHPRYAKEASGVRKLTIKGCRFEPHALVVRKGQSVRVTNADGCPHAVRVSDPSFARLLPAEGRCDVKIDATPRFPVAFVNCPIHPYMKCHWLVLDHPYGAATDAAGRFTIPDLPTGEHTFTVWHEKSGWVTKDLKAKVRTGRVTDLGAVRVPLAKFAD